MQWSRLEACAQVAVSQYLRITMTETCLSGCHLNDAVETRFPTCFSFDGAVCLNLCWHLHSGLTFPSLPRHQPHLWPHRSRKMWTCAKMSKHFQPLRRLATELRMASWACPIGVPSSLNPQGMKQPMQTMKRRSARVLTYLSVPKSQPNFRLSLL